MTPGENPFAVKINNNKNNNIFTRTAFRTIGFLFYPRVQAAGASETPVK
jgi:hypothetical protein